VRDCLTVRSCLSWKKHERQTADVCADIVSRLSSITPRNTYPINDRLILISTLHGQGIYSLIYTFTFLGLFLCTLVTNKLRYLSVVALKCMQMYYSVAVNVSSPAALVLPLLAIKREGIVPSRPSRKPNFCLMFFRKNVCEFSIQLHYLRGHHHLNLTFHDDGWNVKTV